MTAQTERETMSYFAHKVTRCTISGTCFSGAEIWSTGFWLGQEGADSADVTPPAAAAIGGFWSTFFTGASNGVNYRYSTTGVKLARMNADGSTDLDNVEYWAPSGAVTGGETGASYPAQVSLAATMISSNVRGPASKGRMFLPGVHIAVGADGRADSGAIGTTATALNSFLSAVNGSVDVPDWLILVSHEANVAKGERPRTSQNKRVEHLRVGNVFDTQRRRRNAMTETYVNRDVAQT
jgi:hypothetical protein